MDAFIDSLANLSKQITPILGAIVLICLIILIIKLINIIKGLNTTVDKTNKTIDMVDDSIDKIQEPLNTAVKISHTVDKAHDVTVSAVTTAKDFVVKSANEAKDKISNYIDKDNSANEIENEKEEEL